MVTPVITSYSIHYTKLYDGPIYREILEAVLDGKLNGRIKTRSEELAFVKDYVQ